MQSGFYSFLPMVQFTSALKTSGGKRRTRNNAYKYICVSDAPEAAVLTKKGLLQFKKKRKEKKTHQ